MRVRVTVDSHSEGLPRRVTVRATSRDIVRVILYLGLSSGVQLGSRPGT